MFINFLLTSRRERINTALGGDGKRRQPEPLQTVLLQNTNGWDIWRNHSEELMISTQDFSVASKNNRVFQILTYAYLQ